MEIKDHVDTDVECRHCAISDTFLSKDLKYDRPLVRKHYSYFWNNFYRTGFLDQLTDIDKYMDHVVCSKYFAILQPYSYDPEKDNNYELHYSRFDKSVEEHGGKLYYVRGPGYHDESSRTLIIVPDKEKSKKWLSTVLGGIDLYKHHLKNAYYGTYEELRLINALEKTLIEDYFLGSPESCFTEAMSYLTGNTIKSGFKEYLETLYQ
jgi:hypothetical protein